MKFKLQSVFIFSFSLFIFSCTNMQTEISKKWKLTASVNPMGDTLYVQMAREIKFLKDSISRVTDTALLRNMNEQLSQEELESQMNMMTSMLAKMKSEGWIEFTKRGKYKQNMSGTEDEGTYALDADGKKLMTTDSKGKVDTLNIDELSNDAMTLSTPKDSTKIMFTAEAGDKK